MNTFRVTLLNTASILVGRGVGRGGIGPPHSKIWGGGGKTYLAPPP